MSSLNPLSAPARFPNGGSRFSLAELTARNPPQVGVCQHNLSNIEIDETERITQARIGVGTNPTPAQVAAQGLYPEGLQLYTTSLGTMSFVASLNPTQYSTIEDGRDLFEIVCKEVAPQYLPSNWTQDVD